MEQRKIDIIAPYTEELLAKMLGGSPYIWNTLEKDWIVLPGVFSPKYYNDPEIFTPVIADIVGAASVWEVGSGAGITAVTCALNGARVMATDINRNAVKNTRLNAVLYGVENAMEVRHGSLFEPLEDKDLRFQFLYWNHPWNGWASPSGREEDIFLAGFDPDYTAVKEYISHGCELLFGTDDAQVLLATSTIADWQMLLEYGRELRCDPQVIWRQEVNMEPGGGSPQLDEPLEFMILQFTP